MSVQITKNSTEFESGGFVFQFSECSLALLFLKKNIEKTPKNSYKYHIYNSEKKKGEKKEKEKTCRKDFPSGSRIRSDSREDKALH